MPDHVDHVDRLDHLVLAGPDLPALVADFARRSGVIPARGGSHTGRGTANHLVGLGGQSYLELIGPDPDQPEPETARPFGIDELTGDRLVTWAVRPPDLDDTIVQARRAGYDPGDGAAMSRRTPAGDELRWRLTPDRGVVPFLIDWGTSTHPTARDLPSVGLQSFTVRHPDATTVQQQLVALGLTTAVDVGPQPGLTAVLVTPNGPVEL